MQKINYLSTFSVLSTRMNLSNDLGICRSLSELVILTLFAGRQSVSKAFQAASFALFFYLYSVFCKKYEPSNEKRWISNAKSAYFIHLALFLLCRKYLKKISLCDVSGITTEAPCEASLMSERHVCIEIVDFVMHTFVLAELKFGLFHFKAASVRKLRR